MDDLITRLTELVRAPVRQQRAGLRLLSRPRRLASLLDALIADEAAVRRVAESSYRHPLGFDKYVLWCRHPAGRIRMHVWWPDSERGEEHLHNHRFTFSSAVVAGLVRSELFVERAEGSPYTRFIDSTPLQADAWRLRAAGSATVVPSAILEVAAGSAYSQAAETFHRVEVEGGLAVTIFLEGVVSRSHSEVLIRTGQYPPAALPRTSFTHHELTERFALLSHLLRGLMAGGTSAREC